MRDSLHSSRQQNGFTLIEIIISVMILAVSLTTLLGLQSSATDEAIRTRNKQTAMLAAREIMAALEYEGADLKPGKFGGTANEIRDRFMPEGFLKEKDRKSKETTSLPLDGEVDIAFWQIQGLPENSVLRVTLKLWWSPNPQDVVEVLYFVPARIS